jgi:uncharacterized membrane protein
MGSVARLGAVEVALVAATLVASRQFGQWTARLAMAIGFLVLGALLAILRQTFQLEVEWWVLFAAWAALGAPWVLVTGSDELWLFEVLVLGAGLIRLSMVHKHGFGPALVGWSVATLAVLLWEIQARRPQPRLRSRWLPRAWALLAGIALSTSFVGHLVGGLGDRPSFSTGALFMSLLAVAWAYHRRTVDLSMQAVMLGVLAIAMITVVANLGGEFFVLFTAVAQSSAAAYWLRRELRRVRRTGQ